MDIWTVMIGFFFGFSLGAGCALAVMYSIYHHGYRRAVADSLLTEPPEKYRQILQKSRPLHHG